MPPFDFLSPRAFLFYHPKMGLSSLFFNFSETFSGENRPLPYVADKPSIEHNPYLSARRRQHKKITCIRTRVCYNV